MSRCKFYKEEEYISVDGGITWTATGNYRKGSLIELESVDCDLPPLYRTTSGDPYCNANCDKYIDVYDQVSNDGGSTWQTIATTTTLLESESYDCGYRTRTTSGSEYCNSCDKYIDVYDQESYDSGSTWQTITTTTTLIQTHSYDCGYRVRTISGNPYCQGYDKYIDEYKQESCDGGTTWTTTATTPILVRRNSEDCGYVGTVYMSFKALENCDFSFVSADNNDCYYSLDNGTTWTLCDGLVSVNEGEYISWKCTPSTVSGSIGQFGSSGKFEVKGNIMSMLYGDAYDDKTSITINGALSRLFYGCTELVNASNLLLPATTLSSGCYENMFFGCTSLQYAPELLATTLAPYCYSGMFGNCTNLQYAPELPATTLAPYCYSSMFYNCSSFGLDLNLPPQLPATTLAPYCYQYMFQNCINLLDGVELPATTLVEGCYQGMLINCEYINVITCNASDVSALNCTDNWLQGASEYGSFYTPSTTTWSTGTSGIPTMWDRYDI